MGTMSEAYPHLIFHNFTSKLGERVGCFFSGIMFFLYFYSVGKHYHINELGRRKWDANRRIIKFSPFSFSVTLTSFMPRPEVQAKYM